ncbi:MAG: TonB-dependent receptor, partial [Phaeodactylibacter sp.]|nr:TonB-dependent receptor [Phaeodactylibacter sp.]
DVFGGFSEDDSLRSVLWNPKEQWFADAYLGYRLDDDRKLFYTGSFFDEEVQNLGNIRRPQFRPYAFDDFYLTRRMNHSLAYEGKVGQNYFLQATTGFNGFQRHKRTLRKNFEESEQLEVPGMQDTAQFSGAMLRATLASQYPDSPFNFQLGVDLRYDDAKGQRIQDSLSHRENFSQIGDYAIFGNLRFQPSAAFTAEAGLRYAYNTRYSAPVIPSLHLKYQLNKNWGIRGSYSQGFRSPDLKELFFEFIDINHFILGNPNLQAEQSDHLHLGFYYEKRGENWRLKGKVKGFYNNIQNKIELFEYVETPEGIAPAIDTATLRFAYFNQAVYKTQGVNLSVNYSTPRFELSANASAIGYYNPASETFSEIEDFSYAIEYGGSATYRWPGIGMSTSLFARVNDRQINFFPTSDAEGNTVTGQRIQEGFSMIDWTLTKTFWKEQVNLTIGARNLLDIQQVNIQGAASGGSHGGGSGSAPVSPGRNVFVRMQLNLGRK